MFSTLGPISLKNFGSKCYLNSGLQGLSSCPDFIKEIESLANEYNDCDKLVMLKDLMNGLLHEKSMNAASNSMFTNWKKSGQQDSFELLTYLINEAYNDLRKNLEFKKKIQSLDEWLDKPLPLRIRQRYKFRCDRYHWTESPVQTDLAFHVTIPISAKSATIQSLVDLYFDGSPIEDYVCGDCNFTGSGYRIVTLLTPLPSVICIHLQRTYFNGRRMQKVGTHVHVVNDLVMYGRFCEKQSTDVTYQLRAVIVHKGFVFFGHYICYKKISNKWFCANDSSVREVSEREVMRSEPYILFYEVSKINDEL